jgi:hypothetical protein
MTNIDELAGVSLHGLRRSLTDCSQDMLDVAPAENVIRAGQAA